MQTTFYTYKNDRKYSHAVKLLIDEDRIFFEQSPFGLKDEIKAFKGCKWHGFDKENPRKIWSIENCPRNVFQIRALMGEDVYEHFDQDLKQWIIDNPRGLLPHQIDMVNRGLTYHYQIFGAEQGLGKSLTLITIAEMAGGEWWYVGPKSAGESFALEVEKWNSKANFTRIITYEALIKLVKYEKPDAPIGIGFDESSAVKTPTANRTIASQWIADYIREQRGFDGYAIGLSGTPSAKSPCDLWAQCEIIWPGYLREGSYHAFEQRYCIMEDAEDLDGVKFKKRAGWRTEEVEQLPNRYKGLLTVYRKKDCLNLPEKKFRRVKLEPSPKVLRVARALAKVAPNTITALTWLRALSSGFQYVMEQNGMLPCGACIPNVPCHVCGDTKFVAAKERVTKMVSTPKIAALREEIGDAHRIVIAASFKGSIERCCLTARELGYSTCVVDGDGWLAYDVEGKVLKEGKGTLHPLKHWKQCKEKVAFIGNPASCRFGITLIEATKMVFFDNSFSAEHRLQMIDRIHRIGTTVSPEIVDLIHLPVDQLVVDTLDGNRELELLSLGAISEALGEGEIEDTPLN